MESKEPHSAARPRTTATPNGLYAAELKAGAAGKAKITLKGRGVDLHRPPLQLTQPVTVQLKNSDGVCWEAVYSTPALKNTSAEFKDTGD